MTTEPGAATGLCPQQIEHAAARLERYFAQRYTSREGVYQARRLWVRFVAFQATCPEAALEAVTQAWVGTLPACRQSGARAILKSAFGTTACDWRAVVLKPYRRNELRLSAGVLRTDARARVRAAVRGPRELALVECLWVLRRAEAAALCWRDLALERGMITVRKGKGSKPSWTLLPPSTRTALAAWCTAAGTPPADAPVFPRQHSGRSGGKPGGHYSPAGLGLIVQKLLARAGLWAPGLGVAHRFRRSFASTYLAANPSDLVGLCRLMRHDQIATTQRYVWFEPEDLAPRMAALEL